MKLPYPASSEPTTMQILDHIQEQMTQGYAFLKRLRLDYLATYHGVVDEERFARVKAIRDRLAPRVQNAVDSVTMDWQPYSVWLRHREVYEPHPVLSRNLVTMKGDTTIPGGIFRRLRHPNPMFLLSGAPRVIAADGKPARIIAVVITGACSNRYATGNTQFPDNAPANASILMDTTDEQANAFRATVVSEILSDDGTQVVDLDWCHLTIPIIEAFTLDDLIRETALDGFAWSPDMSTASHDTRMNYLLDAARVAVSHLLYACSRTVEVEERPRASRPPVARKPGQPRPPKAARMRRLGWRLGASIENAVRAAAERAGVSVPTGRTMAPHIRGAHLHLYRVGPGRQEVDLKWLDPIAVNASRDDGVTVTRHRVL